MDLNMQRAYGKMGAKIARKRTTKKQRHQIARKAAAARWAKKGKSK